MNVRDEHEHPHSGSDPEVECFSRRLGEVVGSEPMRAFARRASVSETVLRKYLNGESTPNLERLIALARAGDVNLEWLATGEGPKRPSDRPLPHKADHGVAEDPAVYALDAFLQDQTIEVVVIAVEELLKKEGRSLPPYIKGRLVRGAIDMYRRVPEDKRGEFPTYLRQMLRIVAP